MLKLQVHAHAAHLWPIAYHGDFASGFSFCFNSMTDQESLGRYTSYPYSIFTACNTLTKYYMPKSPHYMVVTALSCSTSVVSN